MKLVQEILLKYAKVQLFEPQLIRLEIFGDTSISAVEAKEMNDSIGTLTRGSESLILIMSDEITRFSKEAMEFSASDEGLRYTMADALVVKSVAQRLTANFYLKVNKPKKPSRIFNSEKEALQWLFSVKNSKVTVGS